MNNGAGGANLKALQEAVAQVLGKDFKVRCVLAPALGWEAQRRSA